MEKNVNQILLDEDSIAKRLIHQLDSDEVELQLEDSKIYHYFPLYKDEDDLTSRVNVLLISKFHGVIIFECSGISTRQLVKNPDAITDLVNRIEQVHSHVFSRLIKSKLLRSSLHSLQFPLKPIVFAPNYDSKQPLLQPDYVDVCIEIGQIKKILNETKLGAPIGDEFFRELLSVLEGSKAILKPRSRNLSTKERTKGKILEEIESTIANFDADQKNAVLNVIDGPQRIRGLAGSGKTIVLAWKAAVIHLQNPEAEIIYTFYTKSLYDLIKRLITRFFRQFSDKDPDWNKVHILHSWGGKYIPGVYSRICEENGIKPITFSEARQLGDSPFNEACKKLLPEDLKQKYDYIIIDEGQDFPIFFYQLCLKVVKNKHIIWGYDECQNILKVDLQDTKKTFGKDEKGKFLVELGKSSKVMDDIVLHKCYRNPREILIYAFSLGLGIFNERVLQLPENNSHWEDLGFRVIEGNSRKGVLMKIDRPEENTPLSSNDWFRDQEVIRVNVFDDYFKECEFVADSIEKDLNSDLFPEDILIITLDDINSKLYYDNITAELSKKKIYVYNLKNAPVDDTHFVKEGCVTFSTVYKAKGNEAGSVYVVGVDSVFNNKDLITERNKLFTAFTRAKGWLTISGAGGAAKAFEKEYERAKKHYPNFVFSMPDRAELKTLQRDLTDSQSQLNEMERRLADMARRLGKTPDELIDQLRNSKKKK